MKRGLMSLACLLAIWLSSCTASPEEQAALVVAPTVPPISPAAEVRPTDPATPTAVPADALPSPSPTAVNQATSTSTATPTSTGLPPTATKTPTITLAPKPTNTKRPTSTPLPPVDLASFVFPFDVPQVVAAWDRFPGAARYFTYHITHRPARDDPCGYHPGDVIAAFGISEQDVAGFNIDVRMPYAGRLARAWTPGGGGEAFTFELGQYKGRALMLDSYHTNRSRLSLGQVIRQGDVYAHLTTTFRYGGWRESKIHLTLFHGTDFMRAPTSDIVDLAPFALPAALQATHANLVDLVIIYEGAHWCRMSQEEKVQAILSVYLPGAGFCVDGARVRYCGTKEIYRGLLFTQTTNDARSVILRPAR
jgi:hypothetical protein